MSHTMMTCSQTRIAELEARIAELENEKGALTFIITFLRTSDVRTGRQAWDLLVESRNPASEYFEDEDTDEDYYNREDEIDESDILIGIVCTVCQKVLPSLTAKEHLDINNPIHKCPHVRDSQYSEVCDK